MIRKLLLVLLACVSLSRAATVVTLCGTPSDAGSSVSTMSVTCTPASGSYLVIFAVTSPSTTQTIADGGVGNTFTVPSLTNLASFPNWASTSGIYNMWVVSSPINTATTFTVTNSVSRAFSSLQVIQITGLASAAPDCGNTSLAINGDPTGSAAICTGSGANDAILGIGNQYNIPGATAAGGIGTGNLTTQLFKATNSGAFSGYNGNNVTPGTFGVGFTSTASIDLFLIMIKTTVSGSVVANPSVFGIAVQ